MKHINYFESFDNENDVQYHMDMIKDLLTEVIDDFGIDKYTQHSGQLGLFYHMEPKLFCYIDDKAEFENRWKDRYKIRLWIGDIGDISDMDDPHDNKKIIKVIKDSKQIKDFENRLKSVGYIFERRSDTTWYEILISY